ncbi:MAG: zinc-ribbon domain-containing protein, partial [Lachnospiraceae bacterium]|nr:zinc-ribbon domain-containing protein [Lachnospiraceae bacterium]
ESYLEELYTELGKKYYADHKGEEREEGSSFEEIDKLLAELSELREDLANRKGASPCPRCGAEVALDADYCSKCGAFLHEED